MKIPTFLLLTILPLSVLAVEAPSDEDLENAQREELDVGEEPLELDEFTVTAEQFSFEQETALRMVRQALKTPKSLKREDKDVWVCWYRKPVGTHRTYLECSRNGDLAALKPDPAMGFNPLGAPGVGSSYGTIYRSQRPVNKKTFEAMLESLPGSDDFDQEFVGLALAGQHPPRDIPSETELDAFTEAFKAVGVLEKSGGSEEEMIKAIEAQDLNIDRYNRLVDLVETYQSIENEVAYRLGTLKRED
jgi:hypothetical protein